MIWLILLNIILIIIIICISTVAALFIFKYMISSYFRQRDTISYSSLIKCIQSISEDNFFMNYGYWNDDTTCLKKANENLCDYVLDKAQIGTNQSILDVGCGYGIQDFYWLDKLAETSTVAIDKRNLSITAIDIAETQINHANKLRKLRDIPKTTLRFKLGDAHDLPKVVQKKQFDRIISQESAFHYKDRSLFFKHVANALTNDGIFVITDIVLQENKNLSLPNKLFINVASEFLAIPSQNMITPSLWKDSIEDSNLEIIEFTDLTKVTFGPYYTNFITPYILKNKMNALFGMIAPRIFKNIQPFAYVMAVCRRKEKK